MGDFFAIDQKSQHNELDGNVSSIHRWFRSRCSNSLRITVFQAFDSVDLSQSKRVLLLLRS